MTSVASLRQIRRRIRSVENTQKITRAMEMVAAAKLRRFQDFLESARPYMERLETLLNELLEEPPTDYHHPFLVLVGCPWVGRLQETLHLQEKDVRQQDACIALVLFTSDTGLCGTYNSALEESARQWLARNADKKGVLLFVGKHGANAFHKREGQTLGIFSDLRVSRVDEIIEGVRQTLEKAFLAGEVAEVHAAYTRMENLARYEPVVEKILPLNRDRSGSVPPRTVPCLDFLVEPDGKTVLDRLLPAFFEARLRFIFYHALLTEQIARMSAMRQATQNAKEMIDELTLLRNKARQASITKEIIEIVSGSRALKLK